MLVATALALVLYQSPAAYGQNIALREDFNDLSMWSPVFFPKIKSHSTYSIATGPKGSHLMAVSNASASGISYNGEFDVYEHPSVRWRWKVQNIYAKGDARVKSGDDYPARIYITFKYNPKAANLYTKLKYGVAKALYGKYPPHSSLNYIWANQPHKSRIITSPYSKRNMMVVLRFGDVEAGTWQVEEVNVLSDYREAFGVDPPRKASIAFMNDSDNTGEHSVSYLDFIEVDY